MNHRSYPSPARARHQLDRHEHYVDVPRLTVSPIAARTMTSIVDAFRNVRPRVDPARESYAYTCPRCSWHTRDTRYEQHACPGEPAEPAPPDPGSGG